MSDPPKLESFPISPDDPLAAEHAVVAAWVEGRDGIDSKGNVEQARRYLIAATIQCRFWKLAFEQLCQMHIDAAEGIYNPQMASALIAGSPFTYDRRLNDLRWDLLELTAQLRCRRSESLIRALLRRSLPFDADDLLTILQWCNDREHVSRYTVPTGLIQQAVRRYVANHPIEHELQTALEKLISRIRSSGDRATMRFATAMEQYIAPNARDRVSLPEGKSAPQPGTVGTAAILGDLKAYFSMDTSDSPAPTTRIEPDGFLLRQDSPLAEQHAMVSTLLLEAAAKGRHYQPEPNELASWPLFTAVSPAMLGRLELALAERHIHSLLTPVPPGESRYQAWYLTWSLSKELASRSFDLDREGCLEFFLFCSVKLSQYPGEALAVLPKLISVVEHEAESSPLSEGERYVLSLLRASWIAGPPLGAVSEEVTRLTRLIGDGAGHYLVPGEAWTDAVNKDLLHQTSEDCQKWIALLSHALTASMARPSKKWLKQAGQFIDTIGGVPLLDTLARWFSLVSQGRTIRRLPSYPGDARSAADLIHDENAIALRGLLWIASTLQRREELIREITAVAVSAYKKIPGVGPRAVKVGNAAVYALSVIGTTEAVGQLAMLKSRVKFGTAQKEIEKAFDAAARALALPRDQIEEIGVPTYGLEEVGRRVETLGDYRAEFVVTGSDAAFQWFDAKGKALKSVPAKVKSEHKDDWKELQQSLKDLKSMLATQRDRIDSMCLLQKSWPIDVWRERYLDHPLVGTIARRLLWRIDGTPALFLDGIPTDVQGNPVEHGKTAEVTLWHPVGRTIDEITAWRRRLEELQITQPFKQAHREVYLLTDAERRTNTYSNRFAAHVLRQHQFNALCAARGWKNKLRLMVDDWFPPASKELPQWGLRAEFWIDGIGDNWGHDTNDSGVFLRVATDQVRFYRVEAAENASHAYDRAYTTNAVGPGDNDVNEPLPLEGIPPLVLSEILRDVDLFVGVASVGNDPTWQDGGPEGHYREYWQNYSFGELSGSATTRKQVLERLVPRLAIAERCSFSDRFLVVRGDKRIYKIHLGSGNILMEPNDQYLCIVPDSSARGKQDDLYLPFEGDSTLSIILSKAFLLANDTKIKDLTIVRQIDNVA